jgi:hypothetical protein
MAKGQKRSSRETRKPKADKSKVEVTATAVSKDAKSDRKGAGKSGA